MCVNVVKLDGDSDDENKIDAFVEYYSNGEHSETKPEALKGQLEHHGNGMLYGVDLIYSDVQCGECADKYAAFIGATDIKTLPSETYQTAK
ncbi:hypothetical protein GGF42_004544 [Coemansia sp. RSA 2424]|nr:hypothetical protein GGF42_004544 [Coemansia sp. RSA 2424]